jgi:hypothetical protein
VKEQSHKDEMSAALRGDFARLRDRGVAATLVPHDDVPTDRAEADAQSPDRVEPAPTAVPEPAPGPPEEAGPPEPRDEPGPRSWLSRLAGR